MAARAGASVILVERYGVLGGMSAQGEVTPFMPTVVSIGQAAGVAAAMSAQTGVDVSALDGKAIRGKLIELGAALK